MILIKLCDTTAAGWDTVCLYANIFQFFFFNYNRLRTEIKDERTGNPMIECNEDQGR